MVKTRVLKLENLVHILIKIVGLVFGSSIIALFLLWLVYMLPTETMTENLIASKETLYAQDDSQFLLDAEFWKAYDRGTNIIMLYEVIYPNTGNAFQDALLSPTYNYLARWGEDWAEVLMEYASDVNASTDYVPYARYWHGYLVFLKPLFMFLNLQGIYFLNAFVVSLLTIIIARLFYKRLGNYWIAYMVTILLMHPFNIVQSFQLSTVFYAMQITLLIMLLSDKWKYEQMLYIFTLDGIMVAFLDFLTYPYVALGIPLLTYYLLNREQKLKDNVVNAIINAIAFVIGYAGMWGMKWVYATLFTSENVIADAMNSFLQRTGVVENGSDTHFMEISVKDALIRNLDSFFNEQNVRILAVVLLLALVWIVVSKKKFQFVRQDAVVCALMAITPFVWIAILSNHCSLHPHLEWRTFSVLIYAVLLFGICSFDSKIERDNSRKKRKKKIHG